MVISKSEYMMFLKHPAWLWLKKHNKKILPLPNASLQALFDQGNLFESYAEKLFPDGITLGFNDFGEYRTLPKRTEEALKQGKNTIFQGRFEVDSITCIVDVLVRVEGNTFDLYEIKSSTSVKKEHEYDLAFQTIVLESSGLKIRNISVVYVNNEYVRNGNIDNKELSKTTDITETVRELIDFTKRNIKKAHEIVNLKEIPDTSPRHARLGAFNEWFEIYKLINGEVGKYSIYNLTAPGAKRIGELEDMDIKLISEIPKDFKLTPKQHLQADVTTTEIRRVDNDSVKPFIKELKYPLYFLDYETFMGVIPEFDGIRPYQQIPFQYSLHILKTPGGEVEHKEYLHTENSNPGELLIKQLKKDIGTKGSVIVWFEGFEKKCNETLGKMFPENSNFLTSVNDRIIDLMIPFSKGWIADKDFFGSASIKKVLPVIVPKLSYSELDIQEGSSAQRLWMETVLEGKNSDTKEKIMNDLIEYCKLDTLAMVEIFKYLDAI